MAIPMAAIAAYGAYAQGRQKQKAAKRAKEAMLRQRAETMGAASPGGYEAAFNRYRDMFQGAYKPGLMSIAQAGALGEQSNLQSEQAAAGRRGLAGSGVDMALQNAIHGERFANYNQALRDFYARSIGAARDEAARTQGLQVNASLGAPFSYTPVGPSGAQVGLTALLAGNKAYTGVNTGSDIGNRVYY